MFTVLKNMICSLVPTSDFIYAGVSYETNGTSLCWNFVTNKAAKSFLQPCTNAKIACFRQGNKTIQSQVKIM